MGAETPARRARTAREMAEEFGVSTSTVKRLIAEPREEYLARAKARRERVVELRAAGLKHREIANELGIPMGTVGYVLHQAKKIAEAEAAEDHPLSA